MFERREGAVAETGSSKVFLTFAELEFLLREEPGWPAMREQLNGQVPDSPQVIDAGLASLLARGLARVTSDGYVVEEEVRALASGLVGCP